MSGSRRALSFTCLLIVAAFSVPLAAAAPVSEDVPVPGGIAALAQSLGIAPLPEPARFMHEVTRLVYDSPEAHRPAVAAFLQSIRQTKGKGSGSIVHAAGSPDVVPVPLTADVWSDAIFRRKVSRDQLVFAILADRQAAFLCHGLTGLDDETLQFLASHPSLLTRLYERSAPLLAAFGTSIHVHDNRVVAPGGAEAVPLWEAVVGENVSRPDRFVSALFDANEGRLAFLYSTVSELDPPRRAFVLGSWMPDAVRLARFKLLATAGLTPMHEWHPRMVPFSRISYDLAMAALRLAVRDDGSPMPPASRTLWARVLGVGDPSDEQPIDAAWIAEHVVTSDVRQRGDRLDQIAFAQRVFGDRAVDPAELVLVLKALPRHRALLLEFERAGFRNLATYAAALRHASRLAAIDGRKGYVVQAQFQGSLALVMRMARVGSIDVSTAEQVVNQLASLPVTDGYAGGVARWIRTALHPLLPSSRDFETAMIAGLSGRSHDGGSQRVTWEGQTYHLDLAAAERLRLERVRERQHAPPLDAPLQMAEAARLLMAERVTPEDLQDAATQFEALAADLPQRSRDEEADNVPPGVSPPVPPYQTLRRVAEDLSKAANSKDLKRAPRIVEPIVEIADDLLARNLLSFAYALSLGDPDGTVLLANDVSHRHDFGFGRKDPDLRALVTWAVPRQEISPGTSWRVSGSLLGMDVGLATLALRRVSTDRVLEAPKLTNNARDTLAISVSLLDPYALRDADRDAIAEAIASGRQRVAAASDGPSLDRLAAELSIEMPRQRAIRWTLAHDPARVESLFSLTDLLVLGGGRVSDLQVWGMAVVPATGCFCSRVFPPGTSSTLSRRPQLGLSAALVPDLNFRVAIALKELALPAALAKVILSGAMQDLIDEARPTDDADWLSLSRAARVVSRERIEDYVAAATAAGPLMPEPTRSPRTVP